MSGPGPSPATVWRAAVSDSTSETPGTSIGCCMARNSPARARCQVGSDRMSMPSRVTDPPSTS